MCSRLGVAPPQGVGALGYLAASRRAGARLASSWVASTRARRTRLVVELEEFLGASRAVTGGRNLHNCAPQDILAFLEMWSGRHAGSRVADGRLMASPGGVQGALSHLSTYFEGAGRGGPYDSVSGRGNPCKAFALPHFVRAYAREAHHAGYASASAVPMSADKVARLLRHLDLASAAETQLDRLWLILRDSALVCYLWVSGQRAGDAGRLRVGDVRAGPSSIQHLPLPFSPFPAIGSRFCVVPFQTKTSQDRRAMPITFAVAGATSLFCLATRLERYARVCVALGRPLLDPRGFLFPSSRDPNRPVTSSLLNTRLRQHLEAMGAWEGETSHSFRRGSLQSVAAGGVPLSHVAAHGQIRSEATLARYLHPARHAKRVRRA